jgi:hypothetical protein
MKHLKSLFTSLAVAWLALAPFVTPISRADDAQTKVNGTIVSIRGDILAVRPQYVAHRIVRVSIDDHTIVEGWDRDWPKANIKPGLRVSVGGQYDPKTGFSTHWMDVGEKPLNYLAPKSKGFTDFGNGWGSYIGTLKSLDPIVVTDDTGTDYTLGHLSDITSIWHVGEINRDNLLIGTQVSVAGIPATDGVVRASEITIDRGDLKLGAMFGTILGASGNTVTIRPRFTADRLPVTYNNQTVLERQVNIDPDSAKIGDTVNIWGRADDQKHPNDIHAIAILYGPLGFPSETTDDRMVHLTGKFASFDPVTLKLANGSVKHILIPGELLVVRIVPVKASALAAGQEAMLVLKKGLNGGFDADTIIIDAPPFVGYGR